MTRGEKLYEGKAKIIYATDDADHHILYFKDDATAFDGTKKGTIVEKGVLNNRISTHLFEMLESKGIATHLVKKLSDREVLVKSVRIMPVEVVVRNTIAGSLAKRMGKPEGESLPFPIVEYYYKDDSLHDPMINRDHVLAFSLATAVQIDQARELALKINDILRQFFADREILLVDFKLEFGVFHDQVLLADEICPDTCRLWDARSLEKMDKDRFRRDLGKIEEAYLEVSRRVCEPV
ncbi:MAG: phosphoribosylaminoimidazolesuccinocarboxamide synthase [Deltaproteobacteria bacterium]|nr:phosphoribosylaminoimidazolesuccinocarboxamide synthase [Candidatus Anaeroferrophillus wilburensis]MBN2890008.1 phosphoribosylaminoimidazolesuccinocarboxamide synthase [Deltaproteobacteria bacterium]